MGFKLNPLGAPFDIAGLSKSAADLLYLKLDQTTPQTIDNGIPIVNQGIQISTTYKLVPDGTSLSIQYWNGSSWVEAGRFEPPA